MRPIQLGVVAQWPSANCRTSGSYTMPTVITNPIITYHYLQRQQPEVWLQRRRAAFSSPSRCSRNLSHLISSPARKRCDHCRSEGHIAGPPVPHDKVEASAQDGRRPQGDPGQDISCASLRQPGQAFREPSAHWRPRRRCLRGRAAIPRTPQCRGLLAQLLSLRIRDTAGKATTLPACDRQRRCR